MSESAACVSCGHTDPHDVPPIQLCRSCPCDGPCEAPACMCPDPLREVHPGCPRHGHSPEAYFEPDTAARPWAKRGRKGPTVIGDEGYDRDRLPHDAEAIGGGQYIDSDRGIWTVIPESEDRWAQRGGQYRRRLRRLYERARHRD